MHCVIVGASHAGVQAAVNLRAQGYDGEITLISAEKVLPYQRPPLSKAFLQDTLPEQRLWLRPEAFYQQKNINLMLDTNVVGINRQSQTVELANGQCLAYDDLILATGASVRRLSIAGADLKGVYYLRDHQDATGIKQALPKVKKVVVIGGGYIGLEAAASLRKMGKEVTVLINSQRPLQHLTSPGISDFITALHQQNGVTIVTNTMAVEITGDTQVTSVIADNGKHYEADMVVAGIGVQPAHSLASGCGLNVSNGIDVNGFMQTNDPHIYAIGDCVNFAHPVYHKKLRIESVQNATDQAKTVALTLCNKPAPYNAFPWFWSDQYDAKLQIAGLSAGYTDVVVRQESEKSLAAFYFVHNKLIAVDTINQTKSFMVARKYLPQLPELDKTLLADANIPVSDIFTGAPQACLT
ncbi:FAD-dependent oxidoreductase [Alteromonas sp. C1M14]|uniref:NAD(P)/FAD-dependent oxidoreductase n=1 Tax=Alteromonas sp. C1M14 TaxID=2841567 RepID=UPI001C099A19|nr:FAD-dependent oxidoreductase [Alteromonas sp. C1M14]MBU2979891.1 FAD-dependent oxidoreductase [Alteromonas sp. C1M14]